MADIDPAAVLASVPEDYTPGPWLAEEPDGASWAAKWVGPCVTRGEKVVADLHRNDDDCPTDVADAALIALAPALVSALRVALEQRGEAREALATILADLRARLLCQQEIVADALRFSIPDALRSAAVREALLTDLLHEHDRGSAGDALCRIEREAEERGRLAGVVEERARAAAWLRTLPTIVRHWTPAGEVESVGCVTVLEAADLIEIGATEVER